MRQILCPVVVGRLEELDLLQAALDRARAGRGGLALLRGEAGVGKSRLTVQLEAAARAAGMRVLRGRAAASRSPVPFRPIAEALLAATRAAGPPEAPELAAYRSVLGVLIPEWSAEGPPLADRGLLLHEAALRLLGVLAGDAGALLTLEDLHWADAETLALVEYLADNLAAERVLCVATMRSDEPRPAPTLPALLVERRNALVLDLERLSDAEVAAMAGAALETARLPEGLGPLLASRADGVPFLVEEVLAGLVASGALVREGDAWALRTGRAPPVPETFQGMLRERLRSLGEHDRAVLGAAAVLGRRFDWALLPDTAGVDRGTVLAALRAAVEAQIVSPDDGDEGPGFRFRHALTREAVLEDLLPPERAELAARAAEAVRQAHPACRRRGASGRRTSASSRATARRRRGCCWRRLAGPWPAPPWPAPSRPWTAPARSPATAGTWPSRWTRCSWRCCRWRASRTAPSRPASGWWPRWRGRRRRRGAPGRRDCRWAGRWRALAHGTGPWRSSTRPPGWRGRPVTRACSPACGRSGRRSRCGAAATRRASSLPPGPWPWPSGSPSGRWPASAWTCSGAARRCGTTIGASRCSGGSWRSPSGPTSGCGRCGRCWSSARWR